jgi:hypothetical protein
VLLDASFVDNTGTPLADVFVELEPTRTGGETYTVRTDSAGKIVAHVYQNTDYTLSVFGSSGCATPAFTTGFKTLNVDLSLGKQTLTNLVKSTVTGRLVDCNNSPVSSGQVILHREGRTTRVLANSAGVFSFSLPACNSGSPQTIQLTGQDNSTLQTGAPVTISVQPGANNAGTVPTCHTQPSAQEFINYSIDNDYFSLQSPADTLAHSIQFGTGWHAFRGEQRSYPNSSIYFTCYQNAALGTQSPGLDEFSIGTYYGRHVPSGSDSVAVTYTEFGPVGGFIAGQFTLPIIHSSTRSVHIARVKFRIRRRS